MKEVEDLQEIHKKITMLDAYVRELRDMFNPGNNDVLIALKLHYKRLGKINADLEQARAKIEGLLVEVRR